MPWIGIVVAVTDTTTSAREINSLVNCIAMRKGLDGTESNPGEDELYMPKAPAESDGKSETIRKCGVFPLDGTGSLLRIAGSQLIRDPYACWTDLSDAVIRN
jgi:hypothetical protein